MTIMILKIEKSTDRISRISTYAPTCPIAFTFFFSKSLVLINLLGLLCCTRGKILSTCQPPVHVGSESLSYVAAQFDHEGFCGPHPQLYPRFGLLPQLVTVPKLDFSLCFLFYLRFSFLQKNLGKR